MSELSDTINDLIDTRDRVNESIDNISDIFKSINASRKKAIYMRENYNVFS